MVHNPTPDSAIIVGKQITWETIVGISENSNAESVTSVTTKLVCVLKKHQANNGEIPALDSWEDFPPLPVQDDVEQVTSTIPYFVENRFPYHLPQAAGETFQSRPDHCPDAAIPRTAHPVLQKPWAPQTVPTTIPVVRLTTPMYPMFDEPPLVPTHISLELCVHHNGLMPYPMVDKLPVHVNPYQCGTQHALQGSTHQAAVMFHSIMLQKLISTHGHICHIRW